jgi:hypothetical protein
MSASLQLVIARLNDAVSGGPETSQRVWDGTDARCEQLRQYLVPPEIHQIPTRDDQTLLYTAVYSPDPAIHGTVRVRD